MGEQCDDFFGRDGGMRRPNEVYKCNDVSSLVSGIIDFDRSVAQINQSSNPLTLAKLQPVDDFQSVKRSKQQLAERAHLIEDHLGSMQEHADGDNSEENHGKIAIDFR